jgi:hypothetical protein
MLCVSLFNPFIGGHAMRKATVSSLQSKIEKAQKFVARAEKKRALIAIWEGQMEDLLNPDNVEKLDTEEARLEKRLAAIRAQKEALTVQNVDENSD